MGSADTSSSGSVVFWKGRSSSAMRAYSLEGSSRILPSMPLQHDRVQSHSLRFVAWRRSLVVVFEQTHRVLEAVHLALHQRDVVVAEDAEAVLEPADRHHRGALLLSLCLARVADVPQCLAQVVDALVQLRARLLVIAHVVSDSVELLRNQTHSIQTRTVNTTDQQTASHLLPLRQELLLGVGSLEEGDEVLAHLVQVADDALALLTHFAENSFARVDVRRLDLVPVRTQGLCQVLKIQTIECLHVYTCTCILW